MYIWILVGQHVFKCMCKETLFIRCGPKRDGNELDNAVICRELRVGRLSAPKDSVQTKKNRGQTAKITLNREEIARNQGEECVELGNNNIA